MNDPVLDHPLIAQRYFFPRRAPLPGALRVPVAEGVELACFHHAPHPDALTIVHFHGNGEIVPDYLDDLLPALATAGVNVLLAEYRGYGASSGTPALGAMLDDVEVILDASGLDPSRVVAFGRSVGSLYAIHAAHRRPSMAGLIIESGIADVHERIRMRVAPEAVGCDEEGLREAITARFDHAKKLGGYAGPLLLLHAEGDDLVDISHAERMARWAAGPVTFERFARGDHNSIFWHNADAYLAAVRRFVTTLGA